MLFRSFVLAAAVSFGGAAPVHGQAQYIPIPGGSSCNDVTPDGTIVVGTLSGGGAYYWKWQTDPAPTAIGGAGAGAVAVSDDGSVILGWTQEPIGAGGSNRDVAAIWTQASGWVSLGYLPNNVPYPSCGSSASSPYDLSGDGTTAVGLSWALVCKGNAVMWSIDYTTPATPVVTGPTPLDPSVSSSGSGMRASAVSGDGSLASGFTQASSRSPAIWDTSNPATGGIALNLTVGGEVSGINDDASTIVGIWSGKAFYMDDPTNPLSTPVNLGTGTLNAGWSGHATDLTNDGGRICGFDSLLLSTEAWMSFQGGQPIGMTALLTGLGVGGVPSLGSCSAISEDGTVITGNTTFGSPWLAVIPSSPASNKMLPEAGSCTYYNPGSMVAIGLPALGATVTLLQDLQAPTNQVTGSTPLLIINVDAPDVNYPCGTVVPGLGNPSGKMELVVSTVNAAFVAYPIPWTGPGDTKLWPLTVPGIPAAIGHKIHVQGAFTPPSFPGKSTLTEGVEMTIGLP